MTGLEIKGRLDRIGKTPLEHFQDIKELEVADGPEITVEDLLPYKCEQVEKSLKALEIIKEKNVSVWGFRNRVFGYQKKQNGNITINDTYEYYLNNFGCYHNGFDIELLTQEEFELLKEVLE